MKIEIKLDNPKYCDNCPCIGWTDCDNEVWCEIDGGMSEERPSNHILRPQQCIEKYGE